MGINKYNKGNRVQKHYSNISKAPLNLVTLGTKDLILLLNDQEGMLENHNTISKKNCF
jgi:hypothetical protein